MREGEFSVIWYVKYLVNPITVFRSKLYVHRILIFGIIEFLDFVHLPEF
jgi:hypothetical protein